MWYWFYGKNSLFSGGPWEHTFIPRDTVSISILTWPLTKFSRYSLVCSEFAAKWLWKQEALNPQTWRRFETCVGNDLIFCSRFADGNWKRSLCGKSNTVTLKRIDSVAAYLLTKYLIFIFFTLIWSESPEWSSDLLQDMEYSILRAPSIFKNFCAKFAPFWFGGFSFLKRFSREIPLH